MDALHFSFLHSVSDVFLLEKPFQKFTKNERFVRFLVQKIFESFWTSKSVFYTYHILNELFFACFVLWTNLTQFWRVFFELYQFDCFLNDVKTYIFGNLTFGQLLFLSFNFFLFQNFLFGWILSKRQILNRFDEFLWYFLVQKQLMIISDFSFEGIHYIKNMLVWWIFNVIIEIWVWKDGGLVIIWMWIILLIVK